MSEIFCPSERVSKAGVQGVLFSFVMLVGPLLVWYREQSLDYRSSSKPDWLTLHGLLFLIFGPMLLLSIYTWRSYYRERLEIRGTTVRIRTVFRDIAFDVCDLVDLSWRPAGRAGSVRFQTKTHRVRLELGNYEPSAQLRMITLLHAMVPFDKQQGWPIFCHKRAIPLRDGKRITVGTLDESKMTTITRRRYDRWLAIGLPVAVVLAVLLAWALDSPSILTFPLVVVVSWALLRWSTPPHGRTESSYRFPWRGRLGVICVVGSIVGGLMMVAMLVLNVDGQSPLWVTPLVPFAPAVFAMYRIAGNQSDAQYVEDMQGAELAVKAWDQPERLRLHAEPDRSNHGEIGE